MSLYLALDFGGTKLAAGLVEAATGAVLARVRRPSPSEAWRSIEEMLDMARQALAEGRRARSDVAGVGISFGGPVDETRQRVRLSHHVPGWENLPLVQEVSRALALPTTMDNDANVQALGEWRFGAGRGVADVLFVNVGTGIGGGVIVGGRLHRGRHGLAGEIGHTVVKPDGPPCTCGKRGCVESLAAGPGIARAARAMLAERPGEGARLRALAGGDSAAVTGELVFRAAAAGDELALAALADACRYLGIGIANAAAIVDPELVVVGGGVAKAGDLFFGPLREAARAHAAPLDPEMLRIVPGALGDDANILGAAALAEQDR